MEYLNLAGVDNVITLKNPLQITSNAKTLGFWFYSNKSDIGSTPLVIKYQDHLAITLSTDASKIYSHCFIGLEYFDIESKLTAAADLKAYYEQASGDSDNLNMAKTTEVKSQQWTYLRCAYNYDSLKYHLMKSDISTAAFPTITESVLKMPSYFKGKYIKYPFTKQINDSGFFDLTISRFTGSDLTLFVRNLALFADYIPISVHIHYL